MLQGWFGVGLVDIAKTWKIEFLHVAKLAHASLPPLQIAG
jgi:hypothetical protein